MGFAYLFICDDPFLGFSAGDVLRVNLTTATFASEDRIVHANYGYLADLLSSGAVVPLIITDVTRLAGRRPAPLRLIA